MHKFGRMLPAERGCLRIRESNLRCRELLIYRCIIRLSFCQECRVLHVLLFDGRRGPLRFMIDRMRRGGAWLSERVFITELIYDLFLGTTGVFLNFREPFLFLVPKFVLWFLFDFDFRRRKFLLLTFQEFLPTRSTLNST